MSEKVSSRYSSSYSYQNPNDSSNNNTNKSYKSNSRKEKEEKSSISDIYRKNSSKSEKEKDKSGVSSKSKSCNSYSNDENGQKERNISENSNIEKNNEFQNDSSELNQSDNKSKESKYQSSCYSEFQGHNMLTMKQILQYKQTWEKMMDSRIPDDLECGYFSVNKFKPSPERKKHRSPRPDNDYLPHFYDYCADRFISDSDDQKGIPEKVVTPLTKQNKYLSPRGKERSPDAKQKPPTFITIPTSSDSESIHSIVPREEHSRFGSDPETKQEGKAKTPSPKKNQYFDQTIDTREITFEAVHSPEKARECREYLKQIKVEEDGPMLTKNSILDYKERKRASPFLNTQLDTTEVQQEMQTRRSEKSQNYTRVYLGKEKMNPFYVMPNQNSTVMAKGSPNMDIDYVSIQNESPKSTKQQQSVRSIKEQSKQTNEDHKQQNVNNEKEKSQHSTKKQSKHYHEVHEPKGKTRNGPERIPQTPRPKSKKILNSSSELHTRVLTPQGRQSSNFSSNLDSELRTRNEYPSTKERRARHELSTKSLSLRTKPEMIIFYPSGDSLEYEETAEESTVESVKSLRRSKKTRRSPRKSATKNSKNNEVSL